MKDISKNASVIYRNGQIYFDDRLAPYQIGSGQQFFLLRIYENPGINQYELTCKGSYDKATTARAVKKLEEQGFIIRKVDEEDRRIAKLYVTAKGEPLIAIIREVIKDWQSILMNGLDEEEQILINTLMERAAQNANESNKKYRKRVVYGTSITEQSKN